ncbi:Glucosyl transferase GtrII [Pseudobutyrivibrio sp. AR14]|uniref:glucosyltransferase domain-containing protein n=1 Tax=Pseudobutyrivibrio sp. AR14 TaxID=1520804 RepID=UPI00088CE728|nr:glucosyltransferase domain-containing protein [Pseudobutyrivibrio sp. AR14]SCY26828.1 Glucosyl transferase GtrII [Pseudobutyrivibrio sp. AR14]
MSIFTDIEKAFKKIKERFSPLQQWAFVAVMVIGLIAHGYIIFNRISYHDNTACLFSLGATYELGRWGLGIIYDLQIFTTRTFAVPVFNGILSMIFIALSASKMVRIFDIKSKVSSVIIGAIMIVYPVVPSIFSFMFTSWPYFLGLLLAVKAAEIIVSETAFDKYEGAARLVLRVLFSAIVLALSLSMYQAFFAVTISIVLIKLLQDVLTDRIDNVKDYAKNGFTYLVTLGMGLGIWAAVAAIFKKLKGIDTMDYKGMGKGYDLSQFPARLSQCIREFFSGSYAGVNGLKYLRILTLCVILATVIHIFVLIIKKNVGIGVKLSAIVGAALLPVGMNVMYILSTSDDYFVDSLMVYGTAFVLILPVILIEALDFEVFMQAIAGKLIKLITCLQLIAIFVITVSYIYLDNAAYLKADIAERQATSYFTQLAANIKSCQGFDDDMEIVFVDFDKNADGTFVTVDDNEELDAIKIEKFPVYSDLVTYGSAINFMQEHCGFGNEKVVVDDGTLAKEESVQAMPTYPDYGSIAVVDGKLIVKFGE